MKLLFDQHLSWKLKHRLSDVFPDSAHVQDFNLDKADDDILIAYAREHGFAVASKDADFELLSETFGAPPLIVRCCMGNCTTARVEELLRYHREGIERAEASGENEYRVDP